jgi:6-phosphofructokinase 1
VIHSIVARHYEIYGLDEEKGGLIYGLCDGFKGLSQGSKGVRVKKLTPALTKPWADRGGTMLGSLRGSKDDTLFISRWINALKDLEVDILYVIGGNGSLSAAYELTKASEHEKRLVVAGIPKTMDNDILWTDQSFGYQSTIDEAAHIIRALKEDAFSTRRLCLIKLFGRQSGFVAAAASLASGCADAVLVPEEFAIANLKQITFCNYLRRRIAERKETGEDYAVVVVAEGVQGGHASYAKDVLRWLEDDVIRVEMAAADLPKGGIFTNEPRHLIRAIEPNPFDQIFCERLADLAVDNALAGFTGFVATRWMDTFVLVPLRHVAGKTKTLDINGLFWKQVVNATGQPSFVQGPSRGGYQTTASTVPC